jgi:hypothetical protein
MTGDRAPRLEATLQERDHLRLKINLAEEAEPNSAEVRDMRSRLLLLDLEIVRHWGSPLI